MTNFVICEGCRELSGCWNQKGMRQDGHVGHRVETENNMQTYARGPS